MRESAVASHVRLDAAYAGEDLWRNNSGVLVDATGRPVRYGLANESKKQNEELKSSDLIGMKSFFITPDMVGQVFGRFLAVETKPEGWVFPKPTNKEEYQHCMAQMAFHDIVRRGGGLAGFATSVADYRKIVGR